MRKRQSLNALRAFEMAARLKSISAAAEELCVTRPAISRQIALLEAEIGCALFERHGNRIALTKLGDELFSGVSGGFELIASSVATVTRRAREQDTVRILVCRDFASRWLAERIGSFLIANPGISIEIVAERNGYYRQDEDFDFRIFYCEPDRNENNRFISYELCRWIDIPVCTPGFARQYLLIGHDICDVPHLIDANYDIWDEWCARAAISTGMRRRTTVFNETALCLSVAASGGGLTIGDSILTLPEIMSGELITPILIGVVSIQAYMVFKSERRARRSARIFENWLKKGVEDYQSSAQNTLQQKGITIVPC
ncbi:LysR family transcriptional regulator [Phyllobacterium sp. 22229]|uniref:LysR family transcriptional regulator n=3 Tax=Pseudomonadota TaxID=1224 RepID=UPI003F83867E